MTEFGIESRIADIVVELAAAESGEVGAEPRDCVGVFDGLHCLLDTVQGPAWRLDDMGQVVEVAPAGGLRNGNTLAAHHVVEDESQAASCPTLRVENCWRFCWPVADMSGCRTCVRPSRLWVNAVMTRDRPAVA